MNGFTGKHSLANQQKLFSKVKKKNQKYRFCKAKLLLLHPAMSNPHPCSCCLYLKVKNLFESWVLFPLVKDSYRMKLYKFKCLTVCPFPNTGTFLRKPLLSRGERSLPCSCHGRIYRESTQRRGWRSDSVKARGFFFGSQILTSLQPFFVWRMF